MQKFPLFDLIEKFLPQSTKVDGENKTNKNDSQNRQNPTIFSENSPPKTKNFSPYFSLIKRHEEISKRIDKCKK